MAFYVVCGQNNPTTDEMMSKTSDQIEQRPTSKCPLQKSMDCIASFPALKELWAEKMLQVVLEDFSMTTYVIKYRWVRRSVQHLIPQKALGYIIGMVPYSFIVSWQLKRSSWEFRISVFTCRLQMRHTFSSKVFVIFWITCTLKGRTRKCRARLVIKSGKNVKSFVKLDFLFLDLHGLVYSETSLKCTLCTGLNMVSLECWNQKMTGWNLYFNESRSSQVNTVSKKTVFLWRMLWIL